MAKANAGASCSPKQKQTPKGRKMNMGGMMMKQKPGNYSYGGMATKKKGK
ncbi:MAG: hypothetical protein ACO23H_16835 [Alphaproteobacteria bacterium]|jgi:hypothetical protein